jgi:hypothetical protein
MEEDVSADFIVHFCGVGSTAIMRAAMVDTIWYTASFGLQVLMFYREEDRKWRQKREKIPVWA